MNESDLIQTYLRENDLPEHQICIICGFVVAWGDIDPSYASEIQTNHKKECPETGFVYLYSKHGRKIGKKFGKGVLKYV